MTFYRAIHNETGEVLEGSTKELGKKLNVHPVSINRAATEKTNIGTHWKILKIEEEKLESAKGNFPVELREEWDRVTEPFKEARRKKILRRRQKHGR